MIRIEPMAERHLTAVAALHRRIFKSRVSAADLRWKYSREHSGGDHGCFVALDGDRAVAFHGGLPQLFELNGQPVRVGQSCDSMAEPGKSARGVYGELLKRTEEHLFANGVSVLFGAANENSRRATMRYGWKAAGPVLSRFSLEVRGVPVLRKLWRLAAMRPLMAHWVRRGFATAALPLSEFQNSLAAPGVIFEPYSPAFLRFKASNRGFAIRVGEARAWLKAAPDIIVGDLFAPDAAAAKLLLDRMASRAKSLGIAAIHCFAHPGSASDLILGELYPREAAQQVLFSPSTPIELAEKFRATYADLDTF